MTSACSLSFCEFIDLQLRLLPPLQLQATTSNGYQKSFLRHLAAAAEKMHSRLLYSLESECGQYAGWLTRGLQPHPLLPPLEVTRWLMALAVSVMLCFRPVLSKEFSAIEVTDLVSYFLRFAYFSKYLLYAVHWF